jgi:hypothetical protein
LPQPVRPQGRTPARVQAMSALTPTSDIDRRTAAIDSHIQRRTLAT